MRVPISKLLRGSIFLRPRNMSELPSSVKGFRRSGQNLRDDYTPNTDKGEEHVYVLTLKVTQSLSKPMNALRERYFPKQLNRTPAHLTLFHALPHSRVEALKECLSQTSLNMTPFRVSAGKGFRMRKGFGVDVDAGYKTMKGVHEQLRLQWLPFLSGQDAEGFHPHWTIMNKVDDEQKVDSAFDAVRRELFVKRPEGQATGLDFWRYDGGKWEWLAEYSFGPPEKTRQHQRR